MSAVRGYRKEDGRKCALFAVSFLVAIAFVPGISGASNSPRWAVLSVCLPLLILPARLTQGHLFGGAFLLWATISVTWSAGYDALWHWYLLGMAFWIGSATEDLSPVFRGLGYGLVPSVILAIPQSFDWSPVAQTYAPAGLFMNKNFLGEICFLAALGLLSVRSYLLSAIMLLGAALAASKAVLAACAMFSCVWLWRKHRWIAIAVCLLTLTAGATAYHLDYKTSTLDHRFAIWADTLDGMTWVGRGTGSFYRDYPSHATRQDTFTERPQNAHNEFLELAYEHGIGALLLLGIVRPTIALAAVLAFLFLSFPLRLPATGFLIALYAGHLVRGWPRLRNPADDWRMAVRRWLTHRQAGTSGQGG